MTKIEKIEADYAKGILTDTQREQALMGNVNKIITTGITPLTASTVAPFAQALSVEQHGSSNTYFTLATQVIKVINERINTDNPLYDYYKDLQVDVTKASVQLEWENFNAKWADKKPNGVGVAYDSTNVEMELENFKWNRPMGLSETIAKYDKDKGLAIQLLPRLFFYLKNYLEMKSKQQWLIS